MPSHDVSAITERLSALGAAARYKELARMKLPKSQKKQIQVALKARDNARKEEAHAEKNRESGTNLFRNAVGGHTTVEKLKRDIQAFVDKYNFSPAEVDGMAKEASREILGGNVKYMKNIDVFPRTVLYENEGFFTMSFDEIAFLDPFEHESKLGQHVSSSMSTHFKKHADDFGTACNIRRIQRLMQRASGVMHKARQEILREVWGSAECIDVLTRYTKEIQKTHPDSDLQLSLASLGNPWSSKRAGDQITSRGIPFVVSRTDGEPLGYTTHVTPDTEKIIRFYIGTGGYIRLAAFVDLDTVREPTSFCKIQVTIQGDERVVPGTGYTIDKGDYERQIKGAQKQYGSRVSVRDKVTETANAIAELVTAVNADFKKVTEATGISKTAKKRVRANLKAIEGKNKVLQNSLAQFKKHASQEVHAKFADQLTIDREFVKEGRKKINLM